MRILLPAPWRGTRRVKHVEMIKEGPVIKIFRIGASWNHTSRVRETMMGEAMEVCPVHLLFKDHKGWTAAKGGVPPTRSVAGAIEE